MISVTSLKFDSEVEESVLEVLRSGNIAQGPKVRQFEELFAEIAGTKHAVAVNNGTTSLIASMQILDLGPGDEVITSPFTFIATLNAILSTGATAVMADIRSEDFNIDPSAIENLITPQTKAIVPIHLYGQVADMNAIMALAKKHDLRVIEDSAQSHGATIDGKPAGSFDLASFSFYATKNLTTGEGGIITTNSDEDAEKLQILRNQGMRAKYEYVMAGNNYRLTDLQAALVIPQLKTYSDVVSQRKRNASRLSEILHGAPGITVPSELPGRSHVWHQYTILLPDGKNRDEFVAHMHGEGVVAGVYYPKLVCDYDLYRNHARVVAGAVENARDIATRVVSLPVHDKLSESEVDTVANAVLTCLGR